ncbi:transthyretin-like family protein [Flavobacterium poyangense]|uniref:hypothetical protein n=1 Tax=Flavobacterium poyangense TaxID=2204302 RepID=UPI00141F0BF4|nr:hypothetical protein [Flavobacterium sp. JXAS1]
MKNIFKGSLRGFICEDCLESISDVEILLYHPYRKQTVAENANLKDTFRYVSKEEAKQREQLFITRKTTDKDGNFEIELDERLTIGDYDIDFVCGTVPFKFPKPKRNETLQFHLTSISMPSELERQEKDQNYRWRYTIAHKWWCYIRGHFFDAWTICGHLMNCKTNTPIANAKVTAMDADFLTDDTLGTATTDSHGHFRIDYSSADFKKTFLSPWINIETDPSFLSFQSGPDVYFKAELSGTVLVNETKSDARKNVGHCLCVKLCSDIIVTDPDNPFPSSWTGIGSQFSASYGLGVHDFDANGFAGSGKNVLYSVIRLTGQAALKSVAGNPIEYRFRISETTALNNTPPLDESNFTKTVGKTDNNLFVPSTVSKLSRKIPILYLDDLYVDSAQSDFDSDGWFDVNHAIERTLIANGLTLADLPLYNVIEEDTLISINTTELTNAADVPNIFSAGQAIPPANDIPLEKFAIRFEIREVINKALNQFGTVGGDGKTLNSVVMNNNPIYRKLAIKELEESTLCSPINGTIHAKYTLYHPYLASGSLHLNNNSLTISRYISDGIIDSALLKRINNNSPLNAPPDNNLTRCTYTLKLASSTRKHNGDTPDPDGTSALEQLFFYDQNQP